MILSVRFRQSLTNKSYPSFLNRYIPGSQLLCLVVTCPAERCDGYKKEGFPCKIFQGLKIMAQKLASLTNLELEVVSILEAI